MKYFSFNYVVSIFVSNNFNYTEFRVGWAFLLTIPTYLILFNMIIVALIMIPSAIAAGILGYMAVFNILPDEWKWLFIIPLVITIGTYIVRLGIYEWWIGGHPPKLSAKEIDILDKHFPYYRRLGSEHKRKFDGRVAVFRDQKKFQMRGAGKVPGDIQLLLSATAIQLTMGFPDEREYFKDLGAVIMFPKTFITPEMSYQTHAVEVNHDRTDCLLIAVNMFVKGLQYPQEFYDCGLYGFAKVFKKDKGINEASLPIGGDKLADKLIRLRAFPYNYIFQYTALKHYELFEMSVEQFFHYPEQMQVELPELYDYLVDVFHQDPLNYTSPGVQDAVYDGMLLEDDDSEEKLNNKDIKALPEANDEPEAA